MYRNRILALLVASALVSAGALAQEAPLPPAPGTRWAEMQNMTPEQRQAAREQAQQRWEAMTEEERAAAIGQRHQASEERRAAAREHWEAMTPEQREAAMVKREEHRAKRAEHRATAKERWESMTPEQREAARAKRAARGGSMRGPGGFDQRPGGPRPGGGG